MKKHFKQLMSVVMTAAIVLSMGSSMDFQTAGATDVKSEDIELHNPVVEMNTCDTVYFGNYWQEDTNGDGVADRNDQKTPIRWRILSRNGNDAYVMADQALDCKPYHETREDITWENATLRKWLNGEFYQEAFGAKEQEAILEQTLVNADNEEYGTEGGADTVDRVYLLSYEDIQQEEYGFSPGNANTQARVCQATAYAERQGARTGWPENSCVWWLRSPGGSASYASYVASYGYGSISGLYVYYDYYAVRPALNLNLASPLVRQGEKKEISQKPASWDLVELGTDAGKPITWRVLSVSGNDAFLLSDRILADRVYHETDESITWKDCSLRSWLNGTFYQETFSQEEKKGIRSRWYENADNPQYGTEGGEDTKDYLTLLSLQDIINPKYGFPTANCNSPARVANENDSIGNHPGVWWLRSPGSNANDASFVSGNGYGYNYGNDVGIDSNAVRPALHFDLSIHPLTKVGTVTATADGDKYQWNVPVPTDDAGDPKVTSTPDATGKPSPTPSPTNRPEPSDKPDRTPDAYHTSKPKDTPYPEETLEPTYTPEPEETLEPTRTPEAEETIEPTHAPEPEESELPDNTEKPDQNDNDDLTDDMPNRNLKVRGLDIATGNVVKKGFLTVPQVQLTWDNNRNCDGYEIWKKTGNKSFAKVDYVDDPDETEWFDTDVKKGNKYTYKVLGYVEEDDGTVSRANEGNSVSVKIRQTVKSCTYTAKRSGKKLKITFKKAEGTKYQIQVKYGKSGKWKKASGKLKKKIVKKVSPKKLKVRVRTGEKVNGKMKYSKWSKVKTVR